MIFQYDELKECVQEDFERFYNMGYDEKQIFPAVLNEYAHGENYSPAENMCIHIFLVLKYREKGLITEPIVSRIKQLLSEESYSKIPFELGAESEKYISDLGFILDSEW